MGPFIKDVGIFFGLETPHPHLFFYSSPQADSETFPLPPHVTPSPKWSPKCYVHYGYQCRRCSRVGSVHNGDKSLMKSHSTFELSFFDNFGENFSFHLTFVISYTNEYCSLTAYISFMLSSLCFAVLITNISDSNQLSIFPIIQHAMRLHTEFKPISQWLQRTKTEKQD